VRWSGVLSPDTGKCTHRFPGRQDPVSQVRRLSAGQPDRELCLAGEICALPFVPPDSPEKVWSISLRPVRITDLSWITHASHQKSPKSARSICVKNSGHILIQLPGSLSPLIGLTLGGLAMVVLYQSFYPGVHPNIIVDIFFM